MTILNEPTVESAALEWLSTLGWQPAHGPDGAPDTPGAERAYYGPVVLEMRLREELSPSSTRPCPPHGLLCNIRTDHSVSPNGLSSHSVPT